MRILILGCPGAGKSTLAMALSRRLVLPARFLDQQIWLPRWVLRDRAEADQDYEAILREPAWVLDGAMLRHLPLALAAADQVLFLDLPRWRCLARVLGRVLRSWGTMRPEMAPGCPEQFDAGFLRWIWNWPRTHRPTIVAALEGRSNVRVFRRPAELNAWLNAGDES